MSLEKLAQGGRLGGSAAGAGFSSGPDLGVGRSGCSPAGNPLDSLSVSLAPHPTPRNQSMFQEEALARGWEGNSAVLRDRAARVPRMFSPAPLQGRGKVPELWVGSWRESVRAGTGLETCGDACPHLCPHLCHHKRGLKRCT